jgi:hypothetical protein
LELAATGASQEVIAQRLGVSIPTVWADLARIDAVANATVESAQFRIQQRNQINAELDALKQAALADPLLDIMERSQLLLAIHDRKIRMHCLDDSSLLPGGKSGDAPVTVVLNVEFEDAADVAARQQSPPVFAPLSLPPMPEEPAPEPVTPEEPREQTTEEALAEIERIRNPNVDLERMHAENFKLSRTYVEGSRAIENATRRRKP